MTNSTDTNQASEDELEQQIEAITQTMFVTLSEWQAGVPTDWHSAKVKGRADLLDLIRTEKLKLLAEVDKSMPTAEQLTTKYGYHMPEKQYGYKLALHDIREVIAKMEAEL